MLQVNDRVLPSGSIPTLTILTMLVCCIYGFHAFIEIIRWRMGYLMAVWWKALMASACSRPWCIYDTSLAGRLNAD